MLAQACRDRERVRFDYQRRDGDETRRLVEPHQLVSAGRRWYLVAWDIRRNDWRSFRLDRLGAPQLAGARFARRELPDADAAAFIARSIRSMPVAHEATVLAHGSLEHVRHAVRWADADVVATEESTCSVRLRAESLDWLVSSVAMLAITFAVEVREPPELVDRVSQLAERLGGATVTGAGVSAHRGSDGP